MIFSDELEKISAKFVADQSRMDAAACASAYAEDSELIVTSTVTIRGRKAIQAAFAEGFAAGSPITGLRTLWCDASADIGCAIQQVEGGDGNMVMLAFRRDGEGVWKVTREVIVSR